jgi:HEAT repeat protein
MQQKSINYLIEQLNDEEDASARLEAARELGRLLEAPLDALPHLFTHLVDEDHMVQKACIVSLGRIAKKAPEVKAEVVDALKIKLKDVDRWTKYWAANWLIKLDIKTNAILLVLLKCLDNREDMILRKSAAETLVELKEFSETIIPELEKIRKNDPQEIVRKTATDCLLKLRD